MTCGNREGMPVATTLWDFEAVAVCEGSTMMLDGTACAVKVSVPVGVTLCGPFPV